MLVPLGRGWHLSLPLIARRTRSAILVLQWVDGEFFASGFRAGTSKRHMLRFAVIFLVMSSLPLRAQNDKAAGKPDEKPLPDIIALMREVEENERKSESIEKDYIFREDSVVNELKKDGSPKKSEERAYEIFWISGVRIARLVRKDGKDLSPDELKKENDRIDKEVAKAKEKRAEADSEGKETDSHGRDEVTLSRILELGSFSNPRRVLVAGRPTILLDYNGNPDAKSHNAAEAIFKVLTGLVAVDEQDQAVQHVEAHFTRDYKVGGGLVADVKAGTAFSATNNLINNEVWLPSHAEAQGRLHYLLFFSLNGDAHIQVSDYRKFKTATTILPGFQKAPDDPPPPQQPN